MNLLHVKCLARAAASSRLKLRHLELIYSTSSNRSNSLSSHIGNTSNVLQHNCWFNDEPGPKSFHTGPSSQCLPAACKLGAGLDGAAKLIKLERLSCSLGSRALTMERNTELEADASPAANFFEELAEGEHVVLFYI